MAVLAKASQDPDQPELDRLELLLEQIKAVETERTRCLPRKSRAARPRPCYWISMASGPNSPRFSGPKDCSGTSTIGAKLLPMQGWRRRLGKVDRRSRAGVSKAGNPRLRTNSFNSPGYGCAISRNPRWLCGLKNGLRATAAVIKDDHSRTGAQAAGGTVEICHAGVVIEEP